jgi:hypothetical protein
MGRGRFTTTFLGAEEACVVVGTTTFRQVMDTVGARGPD